MPKQIRTALDPFSNGAAKDDGAMSRNIAQSFFGDDPPEASNGAPPAGAGLPQVIDDASLATRRSALVRGADGPSGDPWTLRGIARGPAKTLPSAGPLDAASCDDDAWQVYSDVCYSSEGYLPGESPFDPPNHFPNGTCEPWRPPQITDQQKVAIDMILRGKKLKDVAENLGIHPGTLWRWRRHDLEFRRTLALASQRALMFSIEQLRQLVPKAVDIVHSQVESGDFPAAIQLLRLVHRHLETYERLAS
jgi:hypothetical protein